MHLNLTKPLDFSPNHQLEFLENIYVDSKTKDIVVIWLERLYNQTKEEVLAQPPEQWMGDSLGRSQLILNRESFLTNAYIKRLKPKVHASTANPGYMEYSIVAAPYFGLPNKDPINELKSVKNFLRGIKKIFSEFYEKFPDYEENLFLHYTNSMRTSTTGFDFITTDMPPEQTSFLKEKESALQAQILADPYLKAYVKHTYSMLQKLGPHSWLTFTTESFFERDADPYEKILKAKFEKEELAGKVEPYRMKKKRY